MAEGKAGPGVAPVARDGDTRSQDEVALPERGMRYGEDRAVPRPAAPQQDVEVERARAPALSAMPPAKDPFDALQFYQKLIRRPLAGDKDRAVAVAA
jgi:hypothetical protein